MFAFCDEKSGDGGNSDGFNKSCEDNNVKYSDDGLSSRDDSDSELELAFKEAYGSDKSEIKNSSFYDVFDDEKSFFSNELCDRERELNAKQSSLATAFTKQELYFLTQFCNQTGYYVSLIDDPEKVLLNSDCLDILTNRVIFIYNSVGKILSFSGCEREYTYYNCAVKDKIDDGATFRVSSVYKYLDAPIYYPVFCSDGKEYLITFGDGGVKIQKVRGIKYGNYQFFDNCYYHKISHVIFLEGVAYQVKTCGECNSIRGAVVDCGVKKYRFSTERTVSLRARHGLLIDRNDHVCSNTELVDGSYDFKVTTDGCQFNPPFKFRKNTIDWARTDDIIQVRDQCNHVNAIFKLKTGLRNPCLKRTVKHKVLMRMIGACYDSGRGEIDVDKLRSLLNNINAYYDVHCLMSTLKMMGANYSYGSYSTYYLRYLKESCAKVKWAAAPCTCATIMSRTYDKDKSKEKKKKNVK